MLLLGLCAAVVVPLDVVWCRGDSGHNALELVWAGCCAPADGGRSCATWFAPLESAADLALPALGTERCADLWLGAPGAVSPSPTLPQQEFHAIAPFGVAPSFSGDGLLASGARVLTPLPRQVQELISTTVLTI